MIDKYLEILYDLSKKRSSLFFLILIPLFFGFIKKYFTFSFRDTVTHWTFLITIGIILILFGVFDLLKFPQKFYNLWPSGLTVALGICFIIISFCQLKSLYFFNGSVIIFFSICLLVIGISLITSPKLPENKLVIAIAQFTPISDAAREESVNLQHRIEQKLREKQHEGAPLIIKHLTKSVRYLIDEQQRIKNAISICEGKAHVILWGDVRLDNGEFFFEPRLTVVRQVQKARIVDTRLNVFESNKPEHLAFKKSVSNEIADIITLIYGISYYNVGGWDKAIEVLEHVKSKEGLLYKGLCYYERAIPSKDPQEDLHNAININDGIMKDTSEESDILHWLASLNHANSFAVLGFLSHTDKTLDYLSTADKEYQTVIKELNHPRFRHYWALAKTNRGEVLRNLSNFVESKKAENLLNEAVEEHKSALEIRTKEELPKEWAETQNNLGIALINLGITLNDAEGLKFIHEAVDILNEALTIRTRKKLPQEWAMTIQNIGTALLELGMRDKSEDGENFLRQAVEKYNKALEVRTLDNVPRYWATTMNNMGNAVRELGIRKSDEEGIEILSEAVEIYRKVLKVRTQKFLPQEWASTKDNLGTALVELGILSNNKELLHKAAETYCEALQIRKRINYPQACAATNFRLGNLLYVHLNDYKQAKIHFERAIESDPHNKNNTLTHYNLGYIYEKHYEKFDLAKDHYTKSIYIDNKNENAHNNLGIILIKHFNDGESAKLHFEKAIEINQFNAKNYYHLAMLLHHHYKDFDGAKINYEQAIQLNDNYAAAHNDLGWLLEKHFKDYEGARFHYTKAIDYDPDLIVARNNLSILLDRYFSNK